MAVWLGLGSWWWDRPVALNSGSAGKSLYVKAAVECGEPKEASLVL